MRILFSLIILGTLFTALLAEDFEWAPITDADWSVEPDSAMNITDAVMLFEKVMADDRKMSKGKCYLGIYRRIRVFTLEGRSWGDVTIPWVDKRQKIDELRARTILPDGRIIELNKQDIHEKEIIKAKGIKVKQFSFSMPAMEDGCIIEYYYKMRTPYHENIWDVQKEIYVMAGEYHWFLFRGGGYLGTILHLMGSGTPNYTWLNIEQPLSLEVLPEPDNAREVLFKVDSIPPFNAEPYTLVDMALKGHLRTYYGGDKPVAEFWQEAGEHFEESIDEFIDRKKDVQKVIEPWLSLESDEEKLKTAYAWIQENIQNTYYMDEDKKIKDNNHVKDVIKRGYGDRYEMNLLFYAMLKQMEIDARIVFAIDREDSFFAYNAKYWQFDRSFIAVADVTGNYNYYAPGSRYLEYGDIPWYHETAPCLMLGWELNNEILVMPESKPSKNRISVLQELQFNEDMEISGKLYQRHRGESARTYRLRMDDETDEEIVKELAEEIAKQFPNSEADSIVVKGLTELGQPVKISANVEIDAPVQTMGDRMFIKPYDLFSTTEKPFLAEDREHPIVFNYPKEVLESLTLAVPDGWEVEGLPPDTLFSNAAGSCQISFRQFASRVSIQRRFQLNKSGWKVRYYPAIQKLFGAQEALEGTTVVFRESSETASN